MASNSQKMKIGKIKGDNNVVSQKQGKTSKKSSSNTQDYEVEEVEGHGNKMNQVQAPCGDDEETEEPTTTEEEDGPMEIVVKYDGKIYESPEIYRMKKGSPRGKVLIINIKNFSKDPSMERKGSDVDVKNLQNLFDKLGGYSGQENVQQDLTSSKIKTVVARFSAKNFNGIDIVAVVIMTHGNMLEDKGEVMFGSDSKPFNAMDIVETFSDVSGLEGKPKLFLFQACRGPIDPDSDDAATDLTSDNSIILHSTQTGFKSKRSHAYGTYFIRAFCDAVMNHSYNTHLTDLVPKMQEYIRSKNRNQSICMYPNKTAKKLYFNPFSS